MTENDIMDIRDCAELLKVSVKAVYHMTSRNEIPHSKMGKRLRFSRKKVTAWALSCEVPTNQELRQRVNQL